LLPADLDRRGLPPEIRSFPFCEKTNLRVFMQLRTLLHRPKAQPPCFHRITHSFAKTQGGGRLPKQAKSAARATRQGALRWYRRASPAKNVSSGVLSANFRFGL